MSDFETHPVGTANRIKALVDALQKIAHGTTPEADPDTGELVECWMGHEEMQEIARAALAAINRP
jgi:hypothetical protein